MDFETCLWHCTAFRVCVLHVLAPYAAFAMGGFALMPETGMSNGNPVEPLSLTPLSTKLTNCFGRSNRVFL